MSQDLTQTDTVGKQLADALLSVVHRIGPAAVAFSGGVDSAVVAKAAHEAFADQAVAVTAVSPSLAESDLKTARTVAAQIGIRHVEIETTEFSRPEYQANAGNRCFFCKDTLYSLAASQLKELGVRNLVNGANCDDLGDHRPGMQAANEHNVRSPLIEARLNKNQVRELARFWNLTVAEKPASPCLSSRIAYGVPVTEERVRRVELAEKFLRLQLKRADLRVRHEANDVARIEIPISALPTLVSETTRGTLVDHFRDLGFRRITLDLEGFRSGSMNEDLPMIMLRHDQEDASS